MTKNVDGDSICGRIERLISEYEQSREPESTEIGRQFAVREWNLIGNFRKRILCLSSNYNE